MERLEEKPMESGMVESIDGGFQWKCRGVGKWHIGLVSIERLLDLEMRFS